jgi:HNH endonuclease
MTGNHLGRTIEERFWEKVDKTDGCWHWTAAKNQGGYGRFYLAGGLVQAHRFSYELLVGEIPDDLDLDHTCRNHSCVNPAHLEPVTNAENIRRSPLIGWAKTHCARGHVFTRDSTYIRPGNGRRMCRICYKDRDAEKVARKKAARHGGS